MLFLQSQRAPSSLCAEWTLHLTVSSLVLRCILVLWAMASLLVATMICGQDGAQRYVMLFPFELYCCDAYKCNKRLDGHAQWVSTSCIVQASDICILGSVFVLNKPCQCLLCWNTGDYRSFGPGCEDWLALHLAQQSKQPVCEPEEGIQWHLLARGAHPLLPVSFPSKGCHHRPEVLPWVGQAGEGEAR